MQVQLRKRRGLLSRASTLAIIAAAGSFGTVQQATAACVSPTNVTTPTTLTGTHECVHVNTEVGGDVVNQAVIGPPANDAGFFVGKGGIIDGQLWNSTGTISGGSAVVGGSGFGALTIANGGSIVGGILNDGQILSGNNNAIQIGTFVVVSSVTTSTSGSLAGGITNNAAITGVNNGVAALYGDFSGGLTNGSVISGGNAAVYIADSFDGWTGGITNHGSMLGTNDAAIRIGGPGATNVTFDGGIYNDGRISSVQGAGIFASGASFDGNLENWGLITQTGSVFSGTYGGSGVVLDATTVTGDIINHGTIDGFFRQGVLITNNVGTFTGDIYNEGLIDGAEGGIVIHTHTSTFAAATGAVHGNFTNVGVITGGDGTGVAYFVDTLDNPDNAGSLATITNTGSIMGSHGFVIQGNTITANFVNDVTETVGGPVPGVIIGDSGTGVVIAAQSWTGNITNNGDITGSLTGFSFGYDPFLGKNLSGDELTGDIVNNGSIHGGNTGAYIAVDSYLGNFTNNGSITGTDYGVVLRGANTSGFFLLSNCFECVNTNSVGGGTFDGNATNNGFMSGNIAWDISYDNFINGDVTNTENGVLQGQDFGVRIDVDNFQGSFVNDGTITAGGEGGIAAQIGIGTLEATPLSTIQQFHGNITNTGVIHGLEDGVNVLLDGYFAGKNGGFSNSGSIVGEFGAGVNINVNEWTGNFTNESGGVIEGGQTGVFINGGTISGNFTNDGFIRGVTGVFINAGTIITGDFTNNGTIIGLGSDSAVEIWTPTYVGSIGVGVGGFASAPSNAFRLKIDDFSGGNIFNNGTIVGTSGNAVVIEAYTSNAVYDGAFTNTGTISAGGIGVYLNNAQLTGGITNNGGTISGASAAISTYYATGATTITNTGDGLILGDIRLANNFGDTFIGEDGGVEGDIIGDGGEGGNDDQVIVQNGTQYFIGKASNLTNFTVEDGGFAVMGARFEGDTNGGGYLFSNVEAIEVNDGGTLYIDKTANLTAETYTQQSGGTLEYFLGAPGGAGFSSLTGVQAAVAGTDYGQVHVSGAATLDGTIAGYFDPAYATANSGLEAVVYNDVLIADGGITGDFASFAVISNNSLFDLTEVRDANTVDLTVARTSVAGVGEQGGIIIQISGPWKSMVNDRSNGVSATGCGVSGAGWCLNAYAANDPGNVNTMTDEGLDAFNWLRTGVRRAGETALWGRAVGVWGDTNGDNVGHGGTDFDTGGAIVGIDHAFTQYFMAGAAAQWTRTNIDFNGLADHADVESTEVGGYMSWGDTRLYLNANASVIFHEIDSTRFALGVPVHGNYDGTTISGYAEVGKIYETYEGVRIQPLGALSYAHLDTDAYNETSPGPATLLHVFDSELDSLKSLIGARFAYPFSDSTNHKIVPEVRALWQHEFMDDHSSVQANPIGFPLAVSTITGQEFSRDTLILGTGLTMALANNTNLFLDYDAGLNEDITTHTVSGGLRTTW